jgi:hypothetical protein
MYVGGFSIGGCPFLTGHLFCPDRSDLWIKLWITFDRKVEGALPIRQPYSQITLRIK